MATRSKSYAYIVLLLCAGCGIGKVYNGVHGVNKSRSGASSDDGSGDGTGGNVIGTDVMVSAPGMTLTTRISPEAPGCGRGQVAPAAQTPVEFVFTVDRSGSMNDSHDAEAQNRPTKWASLQAALTALFDNMGNTTAGAAVALGVDYFNGDADNTFEKALQQVDRAWADALMMDISMRSASGHTPTEDALRLSYDAITAYNPGGPLANAMKAVVLVSDGKPNPEPANANVIPNLVAAQLAGPAKVHTFSIGIGELGDPDARFGYDPAFMSSVAVKGGSARPGCDPNNVSDPKKFCHYQITPSQSADLTGDLIAAFNDIRKVARSCTLPLSIEDPEHFEPRAVVVVAERGNDGQRVLPADTWTFDDPVKPTAVVLLGNECAYIKQDPSEHVFAIIGCTCGAPGSSGNNFPPPGRESESSEDPWNTNWCSYPWAPSGAGGNSGCVGEGC